VDAPPLTPSEEDHQRDANDKIELTADLDLPRKVKRNAHPFRFAKRFKNAVTGVEITLTAHFFVCVVVDIL
jgi:hypothetical protein